jgi:uncharacterized membrane protein
VEGIVTQAQDGQPIASAQILVFQLHELEQITYMDAYEKGDISQIVNTDENGAYSLSLEPDKYVIEVQAEGFEKQDSMVEVKSGQASTLDFSLALPSP